MNILVFYPSFFYSNSIEIKCRELHRHCGKVFFLTQAAKGSIHDQIASHGIETYTLGVSQGLKILKFLQEVYRCIKFIKSHNIDIVYAHLHPCIFVALAAQYFCKAKVVVCRHHSDTAYLNHNRKEQFGDKVINLLGKRFLAPSRKVYEQMIKEGVSSSKIVNINYMYDFDAYPKPNMDVVSQIRKNVGSEIVITKIARFVPEKRHEYLVVAVSNLVRQGFCNFKVILLSEGATLAAIQQKVETLSLTDYFIFAGHANNVIDYVEASDLIVHLSNSEASNSVVKEAGLREKPVLLCEDVGDFDDYISDNEALKLPKKFQISELETKLKAYLTHPQAYKNLGIQLHVSVLEHFHYKNILPKYIELHKQLHS